MLGMSANTMEKGAMVIGSEGFTVLGSRGGIVPELSTESIFPLRSTIWLCILPCFAVRWYSFLMLLSRLFLVNFPCLEC